MIVPLFTLIERVKNEPPIKCIWGPIKEGSFGYVFGKSKSGKTTFCENLGMSLAFGEKEFFGKPIAEGKYKVLFISLEEFYQERTARNIKQVINFNVTEENKNSYMVVDERFPRFISIDYMDKLEERIRETAANIVFIDSLSRFDVDIELAENAKRISVKLRELKNKLNITFILVHHTPKLGEKPLTIDSLAGSRVLAQESDFLMGINSTYDGIRYYTQLPSRYVKDQENVTLFKVNDSQILVPYGEEFELNILRPQDGRIDVDNSNEILDTIKMLGDQANGPALMQQLVETEKMSKSTMYDNLKRLTMKNKIVKTKYGYEIVRNT